MQGTPHPLVGQLMDKQSKRGLNDRQMAALLGISISLWRKLRYGERGVSMALMHGITRSFPELQADLLFYLAKNAPHSTPNGDSESVA